MTLVEYHTELERQVGHVRRAINNATADSQNALRGVVNKWVNTERRVEGWYESCGISIGACVFADLLSFLAAQVKELVPKDEPITPGILYVGAATLAGSVFGRYREQQLNQTTLGGLADMGALPSSRCTSDPPPRSSDILCRLSELLPPQILAQPI